MLFIYVINSALVIFYYSKAAFGNILLLSNNNNFLAMQQVNLQTPKTKKKNCNSMKLVLIQDSL